MTALAVAHPTGLARPPRHYTLRDPGLESRGAQVAKVACALGRPFLPWQAYVADVATEINPPGSHFFWRYQIIVIVVPRQAGKTTLMRSILTDRCITRAGTSVVMSAQLGKDSSDRWEDLVQDVEDGPLGAFVSVKRGKGDQRCIWPNRSKIEPFTPTKKGVHGKSPHVGLLDEVWAFSKEDMDEVLTALNPAMVTKRDRQLFIISAAGDATSTYLNELIDACRAVPAGQRAEIAYFEWSADEDADPYDPETWEFHPGLDGLITLEDLAVESKPENNSHANWLRSYLNRRIVSSSTILDLDAFDALAGDQEQPAADAVAYAFDVAIDRTSASIWASWRDDAGRLNLRVFKTGPGVDWLEAEIRDLLAAGRVVGADDGGPNRLTIDRLTRAGLPIQTLSGRDAATAWTALKAAIKAGPAALVHDGEPALHDALAVAAEKRVADAVMLDRRNSLGAIDPALAASTAAWYADHLLTSIPFG